MVTRYPIILDHLLVGHRKVYYFRIAPYAVIYSNERKDIDKNVILFATIQCRSHKYFIIYRNSSVGSRRYFHM